MAVETGTNTVKHGLAQMLQGGVIMDVVTPEQARIAEEAGACAVMALERVPVDTRPAQAHNRYTNKRRHIERKHQNGSRRCDSRSEPLRSRTRE